MLYVFVMKSLLKKVRGTLGWSQSEMATRMNVSQPYVAMLENGKRPLTSQLARKLASLGASPTVLPPKPPEQSRWGAQELAEQLGTLGYAGFAYLGKHVRKRNPAEVLLAGLAQEELEARLVEALPWLLLRYYEMDFDWLVREAKQRDLQNRLGFVARLAREKAEQAMVSNSEQLQMLRKLEEMLEPSRLAREDWLGRKPSTEFGLEWLRANRSEPARHWNLLTTWQAEELRFAP